MRLKLVAAAVLFHAFALSTAHATTSLTEALSRADAMGLSDQQGWRRLLHFPVGASESEIVAGRFFLAPTGDRDAGAELDATLAAAYAPVGEDPNDHALCKYPARIAFLAEALDWTPPDAPDCSRFRLWSGDGDFTGARLMFAAGDLTSPASFFGHILMRFTDEASQDEAIGLFDSSINFGAVTNEDDSQLVYMARGLLGGYLSAYSHTTYFEHHHSYSDVEQRTVWDYQLNLTQEQVDFLVNHSWELQDARWRYFFLTENCAYEFARLMELAVGEPFLPNSKIWSTPLDVFETASKLRGADGQPLLGEVRKVPSRQEDFRAAFATLSPPEKSALRRLINTGEALGDNLSQAERTRVLDAASQYIVFAQNRARNEEEIAEVQGLRLDVVRQRLALPAGLSVDTDAAERGKPPHLGNSSSMVRVIPLENSQLGTGVEVNFRPAFTDFLVLPQGNLPYSELRIGDIAFLLREDQVTLRRLDLLSLATVAPSPTDVGLDKQRALRVRFGAEDQSLSCTDCLVGFAEVGMGRSIPLTSSLVAAGFVDARIEIGGSEGRAGKVGPGLMVLGPLGESAYFRLASQYKVSIGEGRRDSQKHELELRLGAAENWDIRVRGAAEKIQGGEWESEAGIGFSLYF